MCGYELVGGYTASHTYQEHSFGCSPIPGRPAGSSHKDLPSKWQGRFLQVRAWVGQKLAQPEVDLHVSLHKMPRGVSYSCHSDPSPPLFQRTASMRGAPFPASSGHHPVNPWTVTCLLPCPFSRPQGPCLQSEQRCRRHPRSAGPDLMRRCRGGFSHEGSELVWRLPVPTD